MKPSFRFFGLACLIFIATNVQPVAAQETTERYIPIGQSPGLSGNYTWIGEIVGVDRQAATVTIRRGQNERTIRISDTTRIWVDRTAMRRTNTVGSMTDLIVGRRAEVKYLNPERRDAAAWIKVAGN